MKNGELNKLSLKELKTLREQVDAAISAREVQEKADLRRKLADVAGKSGFSVAELFGGGRGGKHGPVAIRYRHDKDPSLTWSGRGRRPLWLAKAGGDIERFKIG